MAFTQAQARAQLEHKLEQTKSAVEQAEQQLDARMDELDNITTDDLAELRRKRLEKLREKEDKRAEWLAKGHGVYREIGDQKDFFAAVKKSERVVCHFYRPTTWRCEIVDKHLAQLAAKHVETRFIKINAEKSPFLCQRLEVVLLPTIVCTKDNYTIDAIEGFDELGARDDFTTQQLEQRLALHNAIDYELSADDELVKKGRNFIMKRKDKPKIRSGTHQGDDSDSWDSDSSDGEE